MAVFANADEVYAFIGGLFDWAKKHPEVGPKLKQTGLIIRMAYTEPEATITVDCKSEPKEKGAYTSWVRGDGGLTAEVTFSMKADVAHRFWLGKVNLLIALTKREIKAEGPIMKVMKILPILKPLYEQYPKVLEKAGRPELARIP